MPTEADFLYLGQRTLNVSTAKFGYSQVAARLGLKERPTSAQAALDTMVDAALNIYDDQESDWENENCPSAGSRDDPLSDSSMSLDDITFHSLLRGQEGERNP